MVFDLCSITYTYPEIIRRRKEVANGLISKSANIKGPVIESLGSSDLKSLFSLYDQIFFDHWFMHNYKGKLTFSLSTRLSKTAGKTICPRNISQLKAENVCLEIRLGTDFFFDFYEIDGMKNVAGINTDQALEALQLVFEHELCHVIEFIYFYSSNCGQKRFKTLAHNLFGHTASTHQLPTNRQIAEHRYGFKPGDLVTFSFEQQQYKGMLYKINKRATVMVKDKKGAYTDKQGNRYTKYYVPIDLLE